MNLVFYSKGDMFMSKLTIKLISLALCLAMLLSFAACTGTGDTSSNIPSQDASEDTSSTEDIVVQQPGGMGDIITPTGDVATKIAEANAINSDVVGWIKIEGTNIDYPVLQDPDGKTNDFNTINKYYEARDLYKKSSKNGVIFADDYNTIGSREELNRNTILYGHNWTNIEKNGAEVRMNDERDVMFAQLMMFSDLEFAKKTPTVSFVTEEDDITWVVFAAFYVDPNEFYYIGEEPSDVDFMGVVNGAIQRSEHIYDVDVRLSDKILTLSTCTRRLGNHDKQRFVVMARMLRDNESLDSFGEPVDNPNPLRPTWYTGNR